MPPRRSNDHHRRLLSTPDAAFMQRLEVSATYFGSARHKLHPAAFGLATFRGDRGDATLCDAHAGFTSNDAVSLAILRKRCIAAQLVGANQILWTIADDGWIYEARLTNAEKLEYHGYPVRASESIAELVYRRFAAWATASGTATDQDAASNCRALYGLK